MGTSQDIVYYNDVQRGMGCNVTRWDGIVQYNKQESVTTTTKKAKVKTPRMLQKKRAAKKEINHKRPEGGIQRSSRRDTGCMAMEKGRRHGLVIMPRKGWLAACGIRQAVTEFEFVATPRKQHAARR